MKNVIKNIMRYLILKMIDMVIPSDYVCRWRIYSDGVNGQAVCHLSDRDFAKWALFGKKQYKVEKFEIVNTR